MISMRLILVVVGALVVHLAMALGFMACRHSGEQKVKTQIKALEDAWAVEEEEWEAKIKALEEEYGAGPLDRIAADPRLDIRTVLTTLFRAVLPETAEPEVLVDRFTEFSVRVRFFRMPEKRELADILQKVFSHIDPALVYQVIFYVNEEYIVVDGEQLKAVRDWKNARLEEIIQKCL